jgi:hypothetical protein
VVWIHPAQDSNRLGGGGSLEYGNKYAGCVIYGESLNLPKNYLLLRKDSTQLRYLFGLVIVFTLKTNFGVRMKPNQVFSLVSKNSNIQEI